MAGDRDPRPLPLVPMVLHAVVAAAFFYALNRYALAQPFETSLTWGIIAAPFAAYLAYQQSRR